MYSRSFKYGLIFPVLFMLACGDSAVNEKQAAVMQANSETMAIDPYALSAEDLKDDSVFSDGARPVSWQKAGVSDPLAMKKFIRKLQVWVRDNQVDSISGYLKYPMRNPGIKDKTDFKLNYRDYFTDGVKTALADQRLNQIFRTEQGAMIGQGQMWINQKDNNIQIIAINN